MFKQLRDLKVIQRDFEIIRKDLDLGLQGFQRITK